MAPDQTRKRFAQIVTDTGGPSAVAVRLNCSPNMITRLMNGSRTPGMKLARAIQELYLIPMQDWVTAPKTEMIKKIA